jgi:hypothetical protein
MRRKMSLRFPLWIGFVMLILMLHFSKLQLVLCSSRGNNLHSLLSFWTLYTEDQVSENFNSDQPKDR